MESFAEKIGMPLDDFIRLYDEQPFELIDGQRIVKMPNVAGHGEIAQFIFLTLHLFITPKNLGIVFHEMPFVLSYTSNWVTGSRTPDVMYYQMERVLAYREADPDYRQKPYVLVPDLVIEIVSPTDQLSELNFKADQYLRDGVQVVWVFDPQRQRVVVHTLTAAQPFTKQQVILEADDRLEGGDLLPGFEIQVAQLFS